MRAETLALLKEKETAGIAKEERKKSDEKRIEELRQELGIAKPAEIAEVQEKKRNSNSRCRSTPFVEY